MAPEPVVLDKKRRNRLEGKFQALEPMRQKLVSIRAKNLLISAVLSLALFSYLLAQTRLPVYEAICFAFTSGLFIYSFLGLNDDYETYRQEFRKRILPGLVKACAPDGTQKISYSPTQGVSEKIFRDCGLFRIPDIFDSEDLITATIGATHIYFSEIHARAIPPPSAGKKWHIDQNTIFKGLFLIADFNKDFSGTTLIGTDTAEELLGRFGRTLERTEKLLTSTPTTQVHLEDPEFERLFNVYSTDQVEARYLITPSFMRHLTKLRTHYAKDIYLSFKEGQMILAIPFSRGWLEPPSIFKPLDLKTLQPCIDQLQLAFGIVEELNLNTRIWSK